MLAASRAARDGGGTGGEEQDIADELKCLDLAIECFSKACSSGNKYVSKAQLNSRCIRFLKELQKPTAASIQQTEKDGIKLVAACIKEGMWLEAHDLASLLPLTAVTSLEYRRHLRSQRILDPLEAGGGGVHAQKKPLASFERLRSMTL